MIVKKVWNHTQDSQCAYCGKIIKLSTIRTQTEWSVQDDCGDEPPLSLCAKHNPKRLTKWFDNMFSGEALTIREGLHQ